MKGGARVGAGRPRKSGTAKAQEAGVDLTAFPVSAVPRGTDGEPIPDEREPLDYMLDVMRDPEVDAGRRDRMAVAAAPYLHAKLGETGKKQSKDEAASEVAKGKFAPAPGPRLAVDNTRAGGG